MELANTLSPKLNATIENRQRLVARKKEIERQIDLDTDFIKAELVDAGLDSHEAGEYVAVLSVRDRATLDKTELVNLGVSTELIKRATKTSTYVQLDVKAKKA